MTLTSNILNAYKVNPENFYFEAYSELFAFHIAEFQRLKCRELNILPLEDVIGKLALETGEHQAKEVVNEIKLTKFPTILMNLIGHKLRENIIFRKMQLSPNQLMSFMICCCNEIGFSFSTIDKRIYPKDINTSKLPKYFYSDNSKIYKTGQSSYSDGKLKEVIKNSNKRIVKVISKHDEWHCFLVTYKSLKGLEKGKQRMPHYHYLSNKSGMTLDELIENIQMFKYKFGSTPHIPIVN